MEKANRIFALAVGLMLLSGVAHANKADDDIRITGTYSDLYWNDEGGDLLGTEVRIVCGHDHYQGTIQIAEGGITDLGVFDVVLPDTGKIVFDVPLARYAGRFVGKIKQNRLVGTLTFKSRPGDPMELSLPKKRSYWDN